ncbi:alpha/beta hydrolase [Nocardia sp. NEAU-G5]|uniref:Alpha/beta hydrolase n=1 Tax=Nocardia albiluteola TaxID=2842303 RepID=A0ABS6BC11_9NOCA|nr:alpha/beta hydrolase fold domain-containing protein [Nocardia albiluteola]MBU3067820.1 alpha/beta hydrolase [Nocardia albiluteola]
MSQLSRPPFDPELDAVWDVVLAVVGDQIPTLTREAIQQLRERPSFKLTDEMVAKAGLVSRELSIPGYEGETLAATVISRADHTGLGPGIYHIHGGGMVTGHRMLGPAQMLPWIVEHDAVLVTVEYRLAPEFPDPYPVEDCYAGLVWTADHAAELGIDADRLIVAGGSAGGGLSAGTALLARDRQGPKLAGQVLIGPMIDDRDQTVSTLQYDDAGIGTRAYDQLGWWALLGERRGTENVSIYAAPARAKDLSGLPPTYIDCGSAEVFRDEDVAYATALWEAGVAAELHVWAGGFHSFHAIAPHTAIAQAANTARNAWVARLFGPGAPRRHAKVVVDLTAPHASHHALSNEKGRSGQCG